MNCPNGQLFANHYLYKLYTYTGNPNIKDSWTFNESILDYQQYDFSNFNDLMTFCYDNWNVRLDDFVPQESTHIP